jgi:hypothetical protein
MPIAVVIFLRILEARKKKGPVRRGEKLRPSLRIPEAGVSRPQPPDRRRTIPAPEPVPLLESESGLAPEVPGSPSEESPPPGAGDQAFPHGFDYLPPLKRAVVFAEILDPPKGLA